MNKTQIIIILSVLIVAICQDEITYRNVPVGYECGSYVPTNYEQCTSVNNTKQFCCFMTSPSGKNFCYRINAKEWKYKTIARINGFIYQMNCNVLEDLYNAIFGDTPPVASETSNVPTGNESRTDENEENLPPRGPDECGSRDPKSPTDCTNSHTLTEFCCLLKPQNGNKQFCKKMSTSFILPNTNAIIIGNDYNEIDCNIKQGSQGLPCGSNRPNRVADCSKFSSNFNSCCFYKSGTTKQCMWLGYKGNRGEVLPDLNC